MQDINLYLINSGRYHRIFSFKVFYSDSFPSLPSAVEMRYS